MWFDVEIAFACSCSHVLLTQGITLASTVRRRPNAFNLWHQLQVAQRMHREDVVGLDVAEQPCLSEVSVRGV